MVGFHWRAGDILAAGWTEKRKLFDTVRAGHIIPGHHGHGLSPTTIFLVLVLPQRHVDDPEAIMASFCYPPGGETWANRNLRA